MSFHSNCTPQEHTSIQDSCIFSDNDNHTAPWSKQNTSPVVLSLKSPVASSSTLDTIHALSPSNPAIFFQPPTPVTCTSVTIVSSARTTELYLSGDYAGTFRGEPFETDVPGQLPLFIVHLGQTDLPQRKYRDILFKFFIPKKPAQFQDSVTVHWLVIQGSPSSAEASSASNDSDPPISSATAQHTKAGPATGIDMDMVKDMLGQLQIDNLPKGAQNLMKAIEAQSLSGSNQSTLSSSAFNPLAMMSMMNMAPVLGSQRSTLAPTITTPTDDIYVTKAELVQLEDRITAMIDQKFLQLEERIMNKLNIS
ncbi:hypothetical protein BGZ59_002515 [Podila verticillata]|nr:hypothetical protein BGZ59_002515 [Podila verticillata]KFH72203.1 hypothetical protein MVEG_02494 [Podila verticillata NRRL 6337]